jgi:hypothetical protein
MLRASTPQLSARPRPRSGCVESMGDRLCHIPARTRTRSGACMLDIYMRTTTTLILLDGGPSQDKWASPWLAEATTARPRPTRDSAPPDILVTTCAGTDTMARRRQDANDDEITEADDTAVAATFGCPPTRGPRQVTQTSMPDDLRTALAMPTTFGPKLFEISTLHAVSAAYKVKVKDTGDLLLLRDWLF